MTQDINLPIIDMIDMEIIMHRDAHFSGNFNVMLDYYKGEGVGAMPDYTMQSIESLKALEVQLEKNLSSLYLTEQASAQIKESQNLYKRLKQVYDTKDSGAESRLISDLILNEKELPKKEIAAIVKAGSSIVPHLIGLLKDPHFFDPLNPGYGRTPIFAAQCLAQIGDPSAIIPLFEAIGHENFYTDDEIIKALRAFNSDAESFLLKQLRKLPFSKENEYAAIALLSFSNTPTFYQECLALLKKPEIAHHPTLGTYLISGCAELSSKEDRALFKQLITQDHLPKAVKNEGQMIIKYWN